MPSTETHQETIRVQDLGLLLRVTRDGQAKIQANVDNLVAAAWLRHVADSLEAQA